METLRAFLAVELGAKARECAAEVVRELRGRRGGDDVRWVRAEDLHVTLRFLGEIGQERIPRLRETVGRETRRIAPFPLALGDLQAFPSPERPRVVALTLDSGESLARLAEAVERGVVASGFDPEPRPFRAHLTLGRIRRVRFPDAEAVAPADPATFEVREVVLFRSQLRPTGAVYTPLEHFALGGGDSP